MSQLDLFAAPANPHIKTIRAFIAAAGGFHCDGRDGRPCGEAVQTSAWDGVKLCSGCRRGAA